MARNIVLLGSTGSIGTQTLDVVKNNEGLRVVALAANTDTDTMEAQIRRFRPGFAAMYDEDAAKRLKERVKDLNVTVYSGMEGLLKLTRLREADTVLTAVVGMIGIEPTIEAIRSGKDIALANKETLVCAGHIIMPLAREYKVKILPVDSEHSAVFQCLNGEPAHRVEKILLTALGGAFRGKKRDELLNVKAKDALTNPNWDMGAKVTVDSATLVNKGLEIMEAAALFGVRLDQIKVVVQPQSIVHSAVMFSDGAVMAQLSVPDMHLPIEYALYYPDRMPSIQKRLDLFSVGTLTFEKPDTDTFKGIPLAVRAAKEGGIMPAVFNAADEVAVRLFLGDRIGFLQIYDLIEEALDTYEQKQDPDIKDILEVPEKVEGLLAHHDKK